ncbi:putative Flagellar biosynthetic protein FlhF [Burkholderiales bacterium]|nr:putative Flagellar biosynthetic protein FlhF [Burkholderiales bacterium]
MGFRRYVAPSAREALERIRKELGPEAVILSNRRSGTGKVEIIAAAHGEMNALVQELAPGNGREPAARAKEAIPEQPDATPARRSAPESFQEFIRRQSTLSAPRLDGVAMYAAVAKEERSGASPAAITVPTKPVVARGAEVSPAATSAAVFRRRPSRLGEARAEVPATAPPESRSASRADAALALPIPPPAARAEATMPVAKGIEAPKSESKPPEPVRPAAPKAAGPVVGQAPAVAVPSPDARVMAELQSLRSVLSDRISNLETKLASKTAPSKSGAAGTGRPGASRQAMTRLLLSGFSPELARRIGEAAPDALEAKDIDSWLQDVIAQQIRCPVEAENPILQPGAIALVGPTGVGKTTTIAKLAARFVVRYGAGALGLITLDSYRIGAHEQLRSYGRILGVPVHSAHDTVSLRELLASMHGKRQVLIDTCGVSQRDQRLTEMLAMLEQVRFADQPIRRVLLINAASHAETLDEVARAWRVEGVHGAVLTKIDEAARIGGALDALTRYQTSLLGLTNGQRVPEDWHPGNPPLLAHIALKPFGAAFCLDSDEIQAISSKGALLA